MELGRDDFLASPPPGMGRSEVLAVGGAGYLSFLMELADFDSFDTVLAESLRRLRPPAVLEEASDGASLPILSIIDKRLLE